MRLRWIRSLISSEMIAISFYSLNTFIFTLIYGLKYGWFNVYYPLAFSSVILFFYLLIKSIKFYQLRAESKNFLIANYKTDLHLNEYDEIFIDKIEEIHADYSEKINKMHGRNKRNEQLLSQFFHNMKTSVSVIELATARENSPVIEDIMHENEKLKSQLEQSLNILRLDKFAQDYLPEKYHLRDLVVEVINDNKSNFIYHEVYPKINTQDTVVFTDRKWFKYLLEQILSNAIKYSEPKSKVELKIEDKKLLVIDSGVGIPSNELDRIFDLFYTGTNGRESKESTGVGLSMVKTVAEMLDLEIKVESQVGVGTTFSLLFMTKM